MKIYQEEDKNMILNQIKNYVNHLKNDVANGHDLIIDNEINNTVDMFDKLDFDFYEYLSESYIENVGFIKDCIFNYVNGYLLLDPEYNFYDLTLNHFKKLEAKKDKFDINIYSLDNMIERFNFIRFESKKNYVYINDYPSLWYVVNKVDLIEQIEFALNDIKGVA